MIEYVFMENVFHYLKSQKIVELMFQAKRSTMYLTTFIFVPSTNN